jgi:amino acid transporter
MVLHAVPLILIALAMIVAPCVAIFIIGMRLKRRLAKSSPSSHLVRKLKAAEVIAGLCFTACLVTSLAIMRLMPLVEDGASFVLSSRALLELGLVWLAFSCIYVVAAVVERAFRRQGVAKKASR